MVRARAPNGIRENDITILWDMPIQKDREIKANRQDIVIKNKKGNLLPRNSNTTVKVTEKLWKYKDLKIRRNQANVVNESHNNTSGD